MTVKTYVNPETSNPEAWEAGEQPEGHVLYEDWLAARPPPPPPPPPTPQEMEADFTARIQARLDDWARTRGYDGILSACTYATSAVAKFAAE